MIFEELPPQRTLPAGRHPVIGKTGFGPIQKMQHGPRVINMFYGIRVKTIAVIIKSQTLPNVILGKRQFAGGPLHVPREIPVDFVFLIPQ